MRVDGDLDALPRLDIVAPRIHPRGQRLAAEDDIHEDLASHAFYDLDLSRHFGQPFAAGEPDIFEILGPDAHDDVLATLGPGLGENALFDGDLKALALELRLAVAADLDVQEVHGRTADEARDEQIDRMLVERLRRVKLLHDAVVQDDDPLAHGHRLDLVVGDVDKRGLESLVQLENLHSSLDAQLGIEVRQRLVHQKDFWLPDDRPPQGDALPLAAGERLGLAIEERLEPQNLGRFAHPLVDLALGRLAELEAK